jgi:hypothetical protein
MTDSGAETAANPFDADDRIAQELPSADGTETVESIAEDVRDDIRLGHVEDDVTHVLEDRLDEAGISMRPEDVDDLAEEIEKDASS